MALTTSNPITIDGKTFDKIAVSIAVSPIYRGASVDAAACLVFTPFRIDAFGAVEKLEGYDKVVSIASVDDLILSGDMDLAYAMGGMLECIQEFITAKGI